MDPNIDRANVRKGKWTSIEDSKLKEAAQRHGGKDWGAVTALVPSRRKSQCCMRWHYFLDPNNDGASGCKGKWAEDEDRKLKDAAQRYCGKDWAAIATLVPGQTQKECHSIWDNTLNPIIALTAGRADTWTEDEVVKLKYTVQEHGGKVETNVNAALQSSFGH